MENKRFGWCVGLLIVAGGLLISADSLWAAGRGGFGGGGRSLGGGRSFGGGLSGGRNLGGGSGFSGGMSRSLGGLSGGRTLGGTSSPGLRLPSASGVRSGVSNGIGSLNRPNILSQPNILSRPNTPSRPSASSPAIGGAVRSFSQGATQPFSARHAAGPVTLAGATLQNATLRGAGTARVATNVAGSLPTRAAYAGLGYNGLPDYGYRAGYAAYPVVGTALRLAGFGYPYGGYGYGGYGAYAYRPYGYYAVPWAAAAVRLAARVLFGVPYYGYGGYGYGGVYGYGYNGGSSYYGSTTTYQPVVLTDAAQAPPVAPTLSAAAQDFAAQGEADFRAGDYEAAVRNWRHALVDNPDNGTLVLLLSQGLFAAGQYDEAAGALQHGLQTTPQDKWNVVVANYQELYANPQSYTDQLRALENANDREATPAQHLLLGYHYGFLNYPREAVRELDAALKPAPDEPAAKQLREVFAARIPAVDGPAKPGGGN